MAIFYLDYVNGNDANNGSTWALAWKTITLGATLERIAPGDIIKIAKSPAPVSLGTTGVWTNLSKTVTLGAAQTLNVDLCETAFTSVAGLITVLSATPTAGGTGYAVNDTFNITTGGTGATGIVTAVSSGVVTGVALVKGGNGGYTTGAGKATVKTSGSGNNALAVNITTIGTGSGATTTTCKEGATAITALTPTSVKLGSKITYRAISPGTLASYQKLSFWIRNSAAITAGQWRIVLCSDTIGEVVVDEFLIPAIPSTGRFLPLTLTKTGSGNLGAATASIAIYANTVAPASASNIIIDDFIACTTDGLNLQSLISKNSAEQGGTEGWYGIQSIDGVTVLLDNDTNTLANVGRGYSGTTETVTTYKRETIKTALASDTTTVIQEVQDSGTIGSNIEFQGGYNTSNSIQDGETFFDGLNGSGRGLYLNLKSFITFNFLNVIRYYCGVSYYNSNNNTITTLTNANNNDYGIYIQNSDNNTIITITNANNNGYGVFLNYSNNNVITTITNANNNSSGVYFYTANNNTIITITNANNSYSGIGLESSNNNVITTITNANNNSYGINFYLSSNNTIKSLSTSGNGTAGIYNDIGINYLFNALVTEALEVSGYTYFANSRIFSHKHDQTAYHRIFTDGGQIDSVDTDRVGGTGIMWKLAITSINRASNYPLNLSIAKIAVVANKLVTVKAYMKITNTTDILGALVCRGGQLTGVASDVKTNASTADTAWHELTITFTPTEAGVIEIEAWAWWVANLADESVYVEDLTISQAD